MTEIASLQRTVAEQDRIISDLNQRFLEANNLILSQPDRGDSQSYFSKNVPNSL